MAHPYTFPTLFDEVSTLSIKKLKEWGYLTPNKFKSGVITWSRDGNKTASISIKIDTRQEPAYIELDYSANGTPINYKIELTTIPSNLGKGLIWAFICPQTGKRTRILYCVDSYFLHREAFQGCMYQSQTYSRNGRKLANYFESLKAIDEIDRYYFKRYYNGKRTKRFSRLLMNYEKGLSISVSELL